jgi:uncharacterized protein YkwD
MIRIINWLKNMSPYQKKDFKHRHTKLIKGATKLVLNLAILAGFGALIWYGYRLFTHKVTPLIGSIVFIVGIAVWVILIRILRSRYKWTKPSFKLTTFSVIAILLILTFAGVQPLANYKDNFIASCKTSLAEWTAERERAEAERAAVEEAEKAEEALEEAEAESKNIEELEHNVVALVNAIRNERSSAPLIWDSELYTYSKQHSEDMASQKRLFHTSMYEPYAENAWGGEGSIGWTASTIVESWMSSDFHRTWLLCPHLQHIAVGIAISDTGMYASWTFWRSETSYSDWWYANGTNPPDWWY